jgi:hypothetical protein
MEKRERAKETAEKRESMDQPDMIRSLEQAAHL